MRFISCVDRTPEARNVCQDFRASLFLLCECAAWDLPKPGGTRSAFADKQQERGNVRSILQDAQRHGQRRACWRGSRLAPSPTRRFPCLFWHVTKQATAPRHRRRTSANNVSQHPSHRHDQEQRRAPCQLSDALGTPGSMPWGTLRVTKATGPLRYSAPSASAACRVLPVPPAKDVSNSIRL